MPCKNILDQLRAVYDPSLRHFLDVPLLYWGKFAVKNDKWSLPGIGLRPDFFEFTAAYERRRVGGIPQLENRPGNFGPGAFRQLHQFGQRFAPRFTSRHPGKSRRAFPPDSDQQHAFRRRDFMLGFHGWLGITPSPSLRGTWQELASSAPLYVYSRASGTGPRSPSRIFSSACLLIGSSSPNPSSHCTPFSRRNHVICRFAYRRVAC